MIPRACEQGPGMMLGRISSLQHEFRDGYYEYCHVKVLEIPFYIEKARIA
jgi:hypothetical protein